MGQTCPAALPEAAAGQTPHVRSRRPIGPIARGPSHCAAPLAALLPHRVLRPRLTRRLQRWRYGLGTFKVDFALDGPVGWTNLAARGAGVIQLGDSLEALFRAPQEARRACRGHADDGGG